MIKVRSYREDYPRVQFYRDSYKNLDGIWEFLLDYDNRGLELEYGKGFEPMYEILVPFSYNCKASLVNIEKRCDNVWYQRKINLTAEELKRDAFLHLEGSDYITTVYINGVKVNSQIGCTYRQSYDITRFACIGENLIVIHCEDSLSKEQVRGKQRWKEHNFECYYKETTGIYKTVWLEFSPKERIESLKVDSNFFEQSVDFSLAFSSKIYPLKLRVTLHLKNKLIYQNEFTIEDFKKNIHISLEDNFSAWNLLNPALYDVTLRLYKDNELIDEVLSYFGVRNIEIKNSFIYLNGEKLYQKLVLDQGYWEDSEYTAPNIEALAKDINMMIELGFNGARKHQKVEDERYLYFADALGFLVWGEMPSMFENTEKSREQFLIEWEKVVHQQYNHPSIIIWTPFNESWGISSIKTDLQQQKFVDDVYKFTKQLDPFRPVISNDGWEHTTSDILTLHHYEQDGKKLNSYYNTIEKIVTGIWPAHHKGAFSDGYTYQGQPILVSEFGGCALCKDVVGDGWGYGQSVESTDVFLNRFKELVEAIKNIPFISGYCYTQLSDVQQEVNGILDAKHHPKFDFKKMKDIQSNL